MSSPEARGRSVPNASNKSTVNPPAPSSFSNSPPSQVGTLNQPLNISSASTASTASKNSALYGQKASLHTNRAFPTGASVMSKRSTLAQGGQLSVPKRLDEDEEEASSSDDDEETRAKPFSLSDNENVQNAAVSIEWKTPTQRFALAIVILAHLLIYILTRSWSSTASTELWNIFFWPAFLMMGLNYWLASSTHAGTIPNSREWREGITPKGTQPSVLEYKADGDRRYCKHCELFKPDRAHHCRHCGVCILRMDHHCPWLGVCIGFRNHKYQLIKFMK